MRRWCWCIHGMWRHPSSAVCLQSSEWRCVWSDVRQQPCVTGKSIRRGRSRRRLAELSPRRRTGQTWSKASFLFSPRQIAVEPKTTSCNQPVHHISYTISPTHLNIVTYRCAINACLALHLGMKSSKCQRRKNFLCFMIIKSKCQE